MIFTDAAPERGRRGHLLMSDNPNNVPQRPTSQAGTLGGPLAKVETANLQKHLTVKQLAKAFDVSERSIYMARRVRREGIPELAEECEGGALKLNAAIRLLAYPPDRQREAVNLVRSGAAPSYKALLKGWHQPTRRNYPPLFEAWDSAPEEERREFLAWIRFDENSNGNT